MLNLSYALSSISTLIYISMVDHQMSGIGERQKTHEAPKKNEQLQQQQKKLYAQSLQLFGGCRCCGSQRIVHV